MRAAIKEWATYYTLIFKIAEIAFRRFVLAFFLFIFYFLKKMPLKSFKISKI